MAQPGISAKIEELQFRIKTDPKSRLFFQLAEELRKNGKLPEAEQVLRTGLGVHTTYLSAWVSLGRVLREQQKNAEAVDALHMAMEVDPGNVVAARLLADAFLDLGEKVEAIKKYKLVLALMPSDEELELKIQRLDQEIQASLSPAGATPPETRITPPVEIEIAPATESPFAQPEPEPEQELESHPGEGIHEWESEPMPDDTESPLLTEQPAPPPFERTIEPPFGTGDAEPMSARHSESPFQDSSGYTPAAFEIERPEGMHIEEEPAASELADPWSEEQPEALMESEPAADVFAPAERETATPSDEDDDITATTTMADLYVRQGLTDEARKIYERILQRHPSDEGVRAKLDALTIRPQADVPAEQSRDVDAEGIAIPPKIRALQQWLAKVGRREQGRA